MLRKILISLFCVFVFMQNNGVFLYERVLSSTLLSPKLFIQTPSQNQHIRHKPQEHEYAEILNIIKDLIGYDITEAENRVNSQMQKYGEKYVEDAEQLAEVFKDKRKLEKLVERRGFIFSDWPAHEASLYWRLEFNAKDHPRYMEFHESVFSKLQEIFPDFDNEFRLRRNNVPHSTVFTPLIAYFTQETEQQLNDPDVQENRKDLLDEIFSEETMQDIYQECANEIEQNGPIIYYLCGVHISGTLDILFFFYTFSDTVNNLRTMSEQKSNEFLEIAQEIRDRSGNDQADYLNIKVPGFDILHSTFVYHVHRDISDEQRDKLYALRDECNEQIRRMIKDKNPISLCCAEMHLCKSYNKKDAPTREPTVQRLRAKDVHRHSSGSEDEVIAKLQIIHEFIEKYDCDPDFISGIIQALTTMFTYYQQQPFSLPDAKGPAQGIAGVLIELLDTVNLIQQYYQLRIDIPETFFAPQARKLLEQRKLLTVQV